MNNPTETAGAVHAISRDALAGNRRVVQETQPLLRNGASENVDEDVLEVPIPALEAATDQSVRILHVDDDPEWIDLTKDLLEHTGDVQVCGETSVVAALDLLSETEFDCIVSDYEMPSTDGLEFLEIVREQYPDLPFFLFTGRGSEEIASEAISAGVTDYVQKKGSKDQYEVLANRINNAVERYRAQQQFWDALSWYRRLVEQDLAGVVIVQQGEFVYVNERFADIFGYSQHDLIGSSPDRILRESGDNELLEWLEMDQSSEETYRVEFRGIHADGSEIPLEIHGGTIQYEGDSGSIGIVWDGETE